MNNRHSRPVSRLGWILALLWLTACHFRPVQEDYFGQISSQIAVILASGQLSIALDSSNVLLSRPLTERLRAIAFLQRASIFQGKGDNIATIQDLRTANQLLNRCLSDQDDSLKAVSLYRLGVVFTEIPKLDSAFYYHFAALDMRIRLFGEISLDVAQSLNSLAATYASSSDAKNSLTCRVKALAMVDQLPDSPPVLVMRARLHDNIGRLYYVGGENEKSLEHLELATHLVQSTPAEPNLEVDIYHNLADVYMEMHRYADVLLYLNKAGRILQQHPLRKRQLEHWQMLGRVYLHLGKPDSTVVYANREIAGLLAQKPPNGTLVAMARMNLANGYYTLGQYDRALLQLDTAINGEDVCGKVHSPPVVSYWLQGLCYIAKSDLTLAYASFQKSLLANNYASGQLDSTLRYSDACRAFTELGKICQHPGFVLKSPSANIPDAQFTLLESLRYFQLADSALFKQRKWLSRSDSREKLSGYAVPMYEAGIEVCNQLYQLTQADKFLKIAFRFSEKCKSLNLSESLQDAHAAYTAQVPDSLLQKEDSLRTAIAHLRWSGSWGKADVQQSAVYYGLNDRYDRLLQFLEDHYNVYYSVKCQETTANPAELQGWCAQQQRTLVEYFVGVKRLYIFTLNADGLRLKSSDLPPDLARMVHQLSQSVRKPPLLEENDVINRQVADFTQASRYLYDLLIAPIQKEIQSQMLLIPDGLLCYVPFEILMDKAPVAAFEFHRYPYLIRDHALGYCFSATLQLQMEAKMHQKLPCNPLLAVAPDFQDPSIAEDQRTGENTVLPGSLDEVSELRALFQGKIFNSKVAFQQNCSEARLIHIASHAVLCDSLAEHSYIALADNARLYLWEIPNLRLNADLVMLSACRTLDGDFRSGEGLISLGRSFAYAGAKCIVASLWNVDDVKGHELVKLFYTQLRSGKAKDDALRLAQLAYLDTNKNIYAYPYYWAGFMCLGDQRPIQ